jgi:N-acetylglucosamine-6-phosphate deacetylase
MRLGVQAALVEGRLLPGDVDVADGVVRGVGLSPAGRGGVAVPGFVDLHVNGFAGVDFAAADDAGYRTAGDALLATGVTAYRPAFITAPEEDLTAALRAIPTPASGPRILGAHLEGPFLSPRRLGAHPEDARRDPDASLMVRLLDAGPVQHVTLAPELPGAMELIDLLVARGITVACGHTDASAEVGHMAFDRGARTMTHLFNAMRGASARDPGIAVAALARPDVTVQVILDGHHLAPEMATMAWRAAAGRMALVTDAVAAAGMGDGDFLVGSVRLASRAGVVTHGGGTLAGSTLTMIEAVRNLRALGATFEASVDAATVVPARIAGHPDLGRIAPGLVADLVLLDDRMEIRRVVAGAASPDL